MHRIILLGVQMDFAENNPNGSINSNQVTVSEKVAAKALDPAFIEEQKKDIQEFLGSSVP